MQKFIALLLFIFACHAGYGQKKYNTDIYILDAAKVDDVAQLVSNKELASSLAEKQFDFKWRKARNNHDTANVASDFFASLQASGTDCPPNIVHVAGNIYKCGNGKLIYIDSDKLAGVISEATVEKVRNSALE